MSITYGEPCAAIIYMHGKLVSTQAVVNACQMTLRCTHSQRESGIHGSRSSVLLRVAETFRVGYL